MLAVLDGLCGGSDGKKNSSEDEIICKGVLLM